MDPTKPTTQGVPGTGWPASPMAGGVSGQVTEPPETLSEPEEPPSPAGSSTVPPQSTMPEPNMPPTPTPTTGASQGVEPDVPTVGTPKEETEGVPGGGVASV